MSKTFASSGSTSLSTGSMARNPTRDMERGPKQEDTIRLIPHTPEYEKVFGAYWVGDCFERGEVSKIWKIEDLREMPYLAHIKKLATSWKTLWQLADFMEVGTTPLQWPCLSKTEQEKRWARTNVTFIEYQPETAPKSIQIKSARSTTEEIGLKETLDSLSHEDGKAPPLRLFIVEDLSQQVIEMLGSRFDIDPLFFREQIADYVWHNTRDSWAMSSSLIASKRQRSWFQLRNVRLRYHNSEESFEAGRKEANMWNVLRRPDNDNNHWHYKDWHEDEEKAEQEVKLELGTNVVTKKKREAKVKAPKKVKHKDDEGNERAPHKAAVSIVRTRTTIWIGKDKQCGHGTVGVILLDPSMQEGKPLWHNRTNWLPTISMATMAERETDATIETGPAALIGPTKSWYDDIVRMTTAYPWFEAKVGGKIQPIQPQVLAYPTLYTIAAEWLVVCDYVKTRLSQIEWEIEMPALFRSKGDAIDSSLKRLHTWRRQIPVFRDMVAETIDHAIPAAVRLTTEDSKEENKAEAFEDVRPDFERILKSLEELQARADKLTDIVVSEISIEDSKLGLEENHNLARLTWLATTFIPLSFVSAFFSMNEDVAALKYTYGWFFVAAIPFTAIIMLLGWLLGGGPLGQRMQKKKEELRKTGKEFKAGWYDKYKFK